MCAARLRSKERELATSSMTLTESQTASTSFNQFIYIDYELDTKNDTLHTISLKFSVPISDLKRMNSLQNDRDIYALKYIKIPIKPNSYQSELYASQLKYSDTILTRLANGDFEPVLIDVESPGSSQIDSDEEPRVNQQQKQQSEPNESGEETSKLLLSDSVTSKPNNQTREARKYFRKFDNKLDALITQNQEIISEVRNKHVSVGGEQFLPISNISYMVERNQARSSSSLGGTTFCSLTVRELLVIALLIVVIFPLVIFVYRYVYISEHDQIVHI